jgi:calcium uptake protein 3, mitochondrial
MVEVLTPGPPLLGTPQDFLESVVEQEPRPRLKRRVLNAQEISQLKEVTPELKKGSPTLFRNLRDKGIISYTEYLFLLSVLTSESQISGVKLCLNLISSVEPQSGFKIAFNMFDTDGNQRVDKAEFLVVSISSASTVFTLSGSHRSVSRPQIYRRLTT